MLPAIPASPQIARLDKVESPGQIDLSNKMSTLPKRLPHLKLLAELMTARGPSGLESEVQKICERELALLCDDVSVDSVGNVIGCLRGLDQSRTSDSIKIFAHMDEISMIVKRVLENGRLVLRPVGGMFPGIFGQGLVEVMGDSRTVPGALSSGPVHISRESAQWQTLPPVLPGGGNRAPDWGDMYVTTGVTLESLTDAGVHAGTPVVIHSERRGMYEIGDFCAGYFMDNRAGIVIALEAIRKMREQGIRPNSDRYFVMSVGEEDNLRGAAYANRTLPGHRSVAVDVGPVSSEYGVTLDARPIVAFQDRIGRYDYEFSKELLTIARELNLSPQSAVWDSYCSDSSHSPRGALLCFPTDNTHGFEVIHPDSIRACAEVLSRFLE